MAGGSIIENTYQYNIRLSNRSFSPKYCVSGLFARLLSTELQVSDVHDDT